MNKSTHLDDQELDEANTEGAQAPQTEQYISACPPYNELTFSEHQTIDFRESSGIVLNLQHAPTPHFHRQVTVGTTAPVLVLQYSSDRAFVFAEEGTAPPYDINHQANDDDELVPPVKTRELENIPKEDEVPATEQEQEQEQLPQEPQSPLGFHLVSNYHFAYSAVEGTGVLSWKNRYKLVATGLSIPPGFATPSFASFAASYTGETYTLEAEYDSKENKTELNCTSIISPISYLLGADTALFAGTKVVSVLPFQKPNFTSILHFASSLWGISWNIISKFDMKSAWSLSFSQNFGMDGILASYRWKKAARSRVVTFATGLAIEANPFSIKMKIDQAKGICCGVRSPFFLGSLGLSLSYLTTGQQLGLGFGVAWDIIT